MPFLTAGPFAGDLLIIEYWGTRGRVWRALKPDFKTVTEFKLIPKPILPLGLAINSQGDTLVTDINMNRVLRYGPDRAFKGVFARVETPNQIAIGPDDFVYVTNVSFPEGVAARGDLFRAGGQAAGVGELSYGAARGDGLRATVSLCITGSAEGARRARKMASGRSGLQIGSLVPAAVS